jgi:hypothetical protein
MADKPSSPFAGLDKALLRSTQHEAPSPPASPARPTQPKTRRASPTTPKADRSPQASTRSSQLASPSASTLASYHPELVETIRKTVKVPGKEVSFIRLTPEEKGQIADIVYTYKRQGRKTTENEINRIAVNFIVEDYRANGSASILARVLDALLA